MGGVGGTRKTQGKLLSGSHAVYKGLGDRPPHRGEFQFDIFIGLFPASESDMFYRHF